MVVLLMGLLLVTDTAAISHKSRQMSHAHSRSRSHQKLKQKGIFDAMINKMNEKDTLVKKAQRDAENRHLENIVRANEQASMIAHSNLELDELSSVVNNDYSLY